jgi:hypothetical protein
MSKRRHYARIVGGRLPTTTACPNCLHKIEAVTAVALDGDFARVGPTGRVSVKGHGTRCAYCWALLIFADESGTLRVMTKEERAAHHPHPLLVRAFESLRPKPPDFTKKTYN